MALSGDNMVEKYLPLRPPGQGAARSIAQRSKPSWLISPRLLMFAGESLPGFETLRTIIYTAICSNEGTLSPKDFSYAPSLLSVPPKTKREGDSWNSASRASHASETNGEVWSGIGADDA